MLLDPASLKHPVKWCSISSPGSSWASAASQLVTTSRPAVDSAAKRDTKTSTCNIKFVPRLLTAYVGRLDNYTTERDLKEFLKKSVLGTLRAESSYLRTARHVVPRRFVYHAVKPTRISSTTWKIGKQVRS